MADPIAERVEHFGIWREVQEARIQAAWDALSEAHRQKIREEFLGPGDRAPDELPMEVIEGILRIPIDPRPKETEEFLVAVDTMRTPKNPASFELGSDTYVPEAVRIFSPGRRHVRFTG